tara:strand:- start:1492 stop:1671 length:180 start_codon:yes stop_codon:yes gene_type:complete
LISTCPSPSEVELQIQSKIVEARLKIVKKKIKKVLIFNKLSIINGKSFTAISNVSVILG